MSPVDTLHLALAAALIAVAYLGWWANTCRCEKCSFHVNEQRVARLRKRDLRHDLDHRGFGAPPGSPDSYPCRDKDCPRNPRDVD